jgi:ComF family protein
LARPLARILVDVCFSASVVSPAGSGTGTAMGVVHGWNSVVPVPLHRSRLAERGYNQAALLAREIARQLQVPHTQAAVRRSRPTPSQTSLGRTQRLNNVRGVFSPGRGSGSVAGQNVLLVDDVMTTGATLSECAAVLKKIGARSVGVVSVVRGHYRV